MAAHKGNKTALNHNKGLAGLLRNREALQGKLALYATYEQAGLTETKEANALLHKILRLRVYLRHRAGHDDDS